ncbi:hypothetical protein N752_06225 [Desulforamulus aquiferis]|nr:hypothetical protein N752_06225 [Desulforamulus aquiferis]
MVYSDKYVNEDIKCFISSLNRVIFLVISNTDGGMGIAKQGGVDPVWGLYAPGFN